MIQPRPLTFINLHIKRDQTILGCASYNEKTWSDLNCADLLPSHKQCDCIVYYLEVLLCPLLLVMLDLLHSATTENFKLDFCFQQAIWAK